MIKYLDPTRLEAVAWQFRIRAQRRMAVYVAGMLARVRGGYSGSSGGRLATEAHLICGAAVMIKGATISDCERYRYVLTRAWRLELPSLVFCMLNPSTANDRFDDPTIRRCMGFAQREGFGGISVVNMFAWRATNPNELPEDLQQKTGPLNSVYLRAHSCGSKVIVAWGANKAASPHFVGVTMAILRNNATGIYCLGVTKSGAPRHPLYVPANAPLIPFEYRS